ncbi:hypothetical protein BDR03DRAFT_981888 [Suillus americanus]|nr:hypothetical protein BDR03DRAFT_981888 [Suillus americanus]
MSRYLSRVLLCVRVWTTTGRLEDPHEELCVKEIKFISEGILEVDCIGRGDIRCSPIRRYNSLSMEDEKFYKFIEDAYTHINSSYLGSALSFFLASSSVLTHLLDLAHTELTKPTKGVIIVKLRSLLDLAPTGEDAVFREDARVRFANSGLYEWLLKDMSTFALYTFSFTKSATLPAATVTR